jgi:hypothetical protein
VFPNRCLTMMRAGVIKSNCDVRKNNQSTRKDR